METDTKPPLKRIIVTPAIKINFPICPTEDANSLKTRLNADAEAFCFAIHNVESIHAGWVLDVQGSVVECIYEDEYHILVGEYDDWLYSFLIQWKPGHQPHVQQMKRHPLEAVLSVVVSFTFEVTLQLGA